MMGRGPDPARSPIRPGILTPTPMKQAAFVAGAGAIGVTPSIPIAMRVRALGATTKAYAAMIALGDAYPAYRRDRMLAVRYGGSGEVTTLGRAIPITMMYGGIASKVPFPDVGFGLTNVPTGSFSQRFVNESQKIRLGESKSRGGEHTSRSGTPEARKSIRGPLAKRSYRRGNRQSYFRRDEDRYTRR